MRPNVKTAIQLVHETIEAINPSQCSVTTDYEYREVDPETISDIAHPRHERTGKCTITIVLNPDAAKDAQ